MGKIHKLPLIEAQRIAAGEVVERPANIVKELVENSLDAGASDITIICEDGGKKLIRIIDNGCGMSHEDALMCIKPHATSKITSVQDLATIQSFGFRGEALSSISSVSLFTLVTREASAPEATEIIIIDKTISHQAKKACNVGTDISIENLFYTIPARQKFLKSSETEWRAIEHLVKALALVHYTCSFTLIHNNKKVLYTPITNSLQERVHHIFGREFSSSLMCETDTHSEYTLTIDGLFSKPSFSRYDRNSLFMFVNKRWIKNYKLIQAITKQYTSILPTGRYPAGIACITIDPGQIDINIHPRKEEVQFMHPRVVELLLEKMVKKCLEKNVSQNIAFPLHPSVFATPFDSAQDERKVSRDRSTSRSEVYPEFIEGLRMSGITSSPVFKLPPEPFTTILDSAFVETSPTRLPADVSVEALAKSEALAEAGREQRSYVEQSFKLIGQFNTTYIIAENNGNLILVDQHAAHERILYEKFTTQQETIARINLIFPHTMQLTEQECSAINPYLNFFESLGITLTLKNTHLTIHATPVTLKDQSLDDLIYSSLACITQAQELEPELIKKKLYHSLYAMAACKAAVKAGDSLNHEEMHKLLEELSHTNNRMTCPHGRPTTWVYSLHEIEKIFKRVV